MAAGASILSALASTIQKPHCTAQQAL